MIAAACSISIREYETQTVSLAKESRDFLAALGTFLKVSREDARGLCDLTASHWVGSVILPNGYISVSPKIGGTNALRMMLEGDGEPPDHWHDSLARIECDDLWDVLAIALSRELSLIRAAGYHGAYVDEEENRKCVRGKVLPIEDMRVNIPVRYGTYCRDAVWSFDIPMNQALSWASSTLCSLAKIKTCQPLLAEATLLNGIKETPPDPDWLPEIGDRYRRAIFLAQLVRKAWSSRTSLFGHLTPNAFVNMNTVFEAFVRARLRKSLVRHELILLNKGTYGRRFSENVATEPDLVIADKFGKVVAIGDVKYKWQWKFVNADVYQINAYLDSFSETKRAYIFFPSDQSRGSTTPEKLPRGRILSAIPLLPMELFKDETWALLAFNIAKETPG